MVPRWGSKLVALLQASRKTSWTRSSVALRLPSMRSPTENISVLNRS